MHTNRIHTKVRRESFVRKSCSIVFLRGFVLLVCGLLTLPARAAVEINYWHWDNVQLPAYKAAARAFEAKNPDIKIRITQIGWNDYWISLTTAFIADTAPDVFANHPARYPELMRNGTLLDLAPFIARDGVKADDYLPGLFDVWAKDGAHYGLPKDWDTVALVYNRALLAEAGLTPHDLENLEWNPRDGGSFARVLARLTTDAAGERADSPRFDPRRVARYGLLVDGQRDGFGQVEWSHLAVANGFRFCDGPWSRAFYYDDARLAETLSWLRDASRRGWIVPARYARQFGGIGANGLFAARKGALALAGSWMIDWYAKNCDFDIGYAPLPSGPLGRKSMFNGLADSIWAGTRHREEAWRWTRYLGSREGQMIVASHGVVFPAIREAAQEAVTVMNRKGADVGVYLRQATAPDGTFPYPLTEHGSDIRTVTRATMDRIFLGDNGADIAAALAKMNQDVNRLFKRNAD